MLRSQHPVCCLCRMKFCSPAQPLSTPVQTVFAHLQVTPCHAHVNGLFEFRGHLVAKVPGTPRLTCFAFKLFNGPRQTKSSLMRETLKYFTFAVVQPWFFARRIHCCVPFARPHLTGWQLCAPQHTRIRWHFLTNSFVNCS